MTAETTCEIRGCEREPSTDVPAIDRGGEKTTLVVCSPCCSAWDKGAGYQMALEEDA